MKDESYVIVEVTAPEIMLTLFRGRVDHLSDATRNELLAKLVMLAAERSLDRGKASTLIVSSFLAGVAR